MKKIIALVICLLLTGCTNQEQTIISPNGDSKTYKFFDKVNYDPEKYTLIIANTSQNITIIKDKNKIYYELPDQIIIEKENKKYTLNKENKTYTTENIISYDDYGKGYLPESLEILKNQNYKMGSKWHWLTKYIYEKYSYKEGTTTYYFKKDKLVKIINETALTENEIIFKQLTTKIDQNKFKIPKTYQEITY